MHIKMKLFVFLLSSLLFVSNASGQQPTPDKTTADENFTVNIAEKKVVETDYESKVELSANSESNSAVSVNIGAAVRAEKITLMLKNIFGDVRFRGSLEKITNQLNLPRPPQKEK